MKRDSLLISENMSCGYQGKKILHDISFAIERVEFLGIIGPNGSGKSTLLRALSRSLAPSAGKIFYEQGDLYAMRQERIARDFAFVAQDLTLNFQFTCREIVLMGRIPYLKRLAQETKEDHRIAEEAMRITGTLALASRYTSEVSAGERQMVIIAKALAQQPKVLFLDEPTAHLDIGHQVKILNLLKKLNTEEKITVIIVLHDLNLASQYCDRIALLHQGKIENIGVPEDVLTYAQIEQVYGTLVLVNKNPVCGRPHVLLVGKEKRRNHTS